MHYWNFKNNKGRRISQFNVRGWQHNLPQTLSLGAWAVEERGTREIKTSSKEDVGTKAATWKWEAIRIIGGQQPHYFSSVWAPRLGGCKVGSTKTVMRRKEAAARNSPTCTIGPQRSCRDVAGNGHVKSAGVARCWGSVHLTAVSAFESYVGVFLWRRWHRHQQKQPKKRPRWVFLFFCIFLFRLEMSSFY